MTIDSCSCEFVFGDSPNLITNIVGLSGNVINDAIDWTREVVDVLLGGERSVHPRDIDLTETSCKSSLLLGYMPCISDPARC